MLTVWSREQDGYLMTSYTGLTPEIEQALRKTVAYRGFLNNAQADGNYASVEFPHKNDGVNANGETIWTPIARTAWVPIAKALQDTVDAAAKAERIATRKAARQDAATALMAAKDANKIGLDPKTDSIIIVDTAVTTVAQIAAGGITREGEPA